VLLSIGLWLIERSVVRRERAHAVLGALLQPSLPETALRLLLRFLAVAVGVIYLTQVTT
jgi:hypothetical protein